MRLHFLVEYVTCISLFALPDGRQTGAPTYTQRLLSHDFEFVLGS